MIKDNSSGGNGIAERNCRKALEYSPAGLNALKPDSTGQLQGIHMVSVLKR